MVDGARLAYIASRRYGIPTYPGGIYVCVSRMRGGAIVRGEAGVASFRVAMRVCVCVMMKVGMCRRTVPGILLQRR